MTRRWPVFTELAGLAQSLSRARLRTSWPSTTSTARRNYAMALEMTRGALDVEDTPEMRQREQRLRLRLSGKRTARLPL